MSTADTIPPNHANTHHIPIARRSASSDTLAALDDTTQPTRRHQITHHNFPNEEITTDDFEAWVEYGDPTAIITPRQMAVFTRTMIYHVRLHHMLRAIDEDKEKVDRFFRKFWGLYQWRRWSMKRQYREFEEAKARNAQHLKDCRWCRVTGKRTRILYSIEAFPKYR
ncbi:hypothetical protein HK104_003610 [Borealophlyctis nickersoniae]|nr:hypothetical protein HK104_003610 [Borealophlyctis nickersoniae]